MGQGGVKGRETHWQKLGFGDIKGGVTVAHQKETKGASGESEKT